MGNCVSSSKKQPKRSSKYKEENNPQTKEISNENIKQDILKQDQISKQTNIDRKSPDKQDESQIDQSNTQFPKLNRDEESHQKDLNNGPQKYNSQNNIIQEARDDDETTKQDQDQTQNKQKQSSDQIKNFKNSTEQLNGNTNNNQTQQQQPQQQKQQQQQMNQNQNQNINLNTNGPVKINYKKSHLLDEGAFGKVYEGIDLDTGKFLAIKTVKIQGQYDQIQKELKNLNNEIQLLKQLEHKNIVKYYSFEFIDDNTAIDIVLEYVPGGSIKSILKEFGKLSEGVAWIYAQQILEGINYLHKNNVLHRDIKGANILIDAQAEIKLTDFGTSKQMKILDPKISDVAKDDVHLSKSFKGSPYWMAPEIINRTGHTISADIWSIGCVMIEMLEGVPPYSKEVKTRNDLRNVLINKISKGVKPEYPSGISKKCINFLDACFQFDPKQRPTVGELLKFEWITQPDINLDESKQLSMTFGSALDSRFLNNILKSQQQQQKSRYMSKPITSKYVIESIREENSSDKDANSKNSTLNGSISEKGNIKQVTSQNFQTSNAKKKKYVEKKKNSKQVLFKQANSIDESIMEQNAKQEQDEEDEENKNQNADDSFILRPSQNHLGSGEEDKSTQNFKSNGNQNQNLNQDDGNINQQELNEHLKNEVIESKSTYIMQSKQSVVERQNKQKQNTGIQQQQEKQQVQDVKQKQEQAVKNINDKLAELKQQMEQQKQQKKKEKEEEEKKKEMEKQQQKTQEKQQQALNNINNKLELIKQQQAQKRLEMQQQQEQKEQN